MGRVVSCRDCMGADMKTCSRCGAAKEDGEFSFRKNGEPKRKASCKSCCSAATRERYAKNPRQQLEYARASRKNPAVRRRINDRRNEARKLNPALELWRLARTRARANGLAFNIDVSDVRVPALCPVFGIPLRWGCAKRQIDCSPTIDRLVPGLGYVKGNVRVISWRANRIKSDATPEELAALLAYVLGA
jgi:hypothetical protein